MPVLELVFCKTMRGRATACRGKTAIFGMAWFKQTVWILDLQKSQPENVMLEIIAVLLILLWLLGMISSYTIGGFIHLLLVFAVILVLVRLIQGRRVL